MIISVASQSQPEILRNNFNACVALKNLNSTFCDIKFHTIFTRGWKTVIYVVITSYTTKTGWADTGKTVDFVYTCT